MNRAQRPAASDVLNFITGQRAELTTMIRGFAEAESPSSEPRAQHEIREMIAHRLARLDYRVRRIPGRSSGGMIFARPIHRRRDRPAQLLLGHYDTVWPVGTISERPFSIEGNVIRGPGVFDMKGGLVQLIIALRVLADLGAIPQITPVVLRQPSSRPDVLLESTWHYCPFVLACRRP